MQNRERTLQNKIRTYLKAKGCYVLVITIVPGIPKGMLDILFLKEGFWGVIEVKADAKAEWQVLQEPTLKKLNDWSWGRKVYPENWLEVRAELDTML